MSPVIFSRKFHFFSLSFAICIELYLNGAWTFAILVIVVFPTFCNSDAGFTWLVAIGNGCSINRSRVIGYCVFCDCVDNLFTVIVFWKIGKDCLPISCFTELLASYFLTIRKETNSDLVRTNAILVVIVFPNFRYWNLNNFWCPSVSNITSFNSCFIAFNRFF